MGYSMLPADRKYSQWPARASLVLAIAVEVFPTEADLMFAFRQQDLLVLLAIKFFCLMVILSPLVSGVFYYGWKAIATPRVTVALIVAIVLMRLWSDVEFWRGQ